MPADVIERETFIEAPVERVWALITEAEHVGTWFGDAGAEVDLQPGGQMSWSWEEHGTALGRVEEVEPPHRFVYRWAPFKDPGGSEPVDGNSTRVEWTLTAENGGTRLRVAESGFESLDCSDKQRIANFAGNTEGWKIELGHLAEHAAKLATAR
jgi:uncharacterized protein YndB with AHSA1/START domain